MCILHMHSIHIISQSNLHVYQPFIQMVVCVYMYRMKVMTFQLLRQLCSNMLCRKVWVIQIIMQVQCNVVHTPQNNRALWLGLLTFFFVCDSVITKKCICRGTTQEITCVQDVIKILQRSMTAHIENNKVVLDVRRSYIVKDALREAKKEKFNPKRLIKV